MPPIDALFGSDSISTILLGIVAYFALLWIAVILWVTKDITNRTNNLLFQIISISLVIFLTPLFGLVLYLIIRPSRTLVERYYEEIEQDLLEQWIEEYEETKSTKKSLAKNQQPKPGTIDKTPVNSLEKDSNTSHNPEETKKTRNKTSKKV